MKQSKLFAIAELIFPLSIIAGVLVMSFSVVSLFKPAPAPTESVYTIKRRTTPTRYTDALTIEGYMVKFTDKETGEQVAIPMTSITEIITRP